MIYWDTEQQFDGASLQYSLDQGTTWTTVGAASGPKNCLNENWYNQSPITYLSALTTQRDGWSGTTQSVSGSCRGGNGSGGWVRAKQTLPVLAGQSSVIFRFIFGAGTICNNFDGLAIDDFYLGEAPPNQADFDIVCVAGDTVDFRDRSLPCPQQYNWDFGDPASGTNNTSTLKNPRHVFSAPGTYTIKLTSGGPNNPPSTITKSITILQVSAIQRKAADCVTDQGGVAEALVQGSSGPAFYNWNTIPAQSTAIASDLSSGIYLVRVSAAGACPATDTVLIVSDNNCGVLRFPTAFTPNRDGRNDGFGVLGGLGNIQQYKLIVYNRWGQEIFSTTHPAEKWNGMLQGVTADSGVYVWMAEITLRNQPMRKEKGTVLLIR
jgi:gliding motility-associated-like protein